jgi:hypothetical protein
METIEEESATSSFLERLRYALHGLDISHAQYTVIPQHNELWVLLLLISALYLLCVSL